MAQVTVGQFRQIPIHPAVDRLSKRAQTIFSWLLFHRNKQTGVCNPRRETLAHECRCSAATVSRALRELRELGFVAPRRGCRAWAYAILPREKWGRRIPRPPVQAGLFDPPVTDHSEQSDKSENELSVSLILTLRFLIELEKLSSELKSAAAAVQETTNGSETAAEPAAAPCSPEESHPNTSEPDSAEALAQELVRTHPQPGLPLKALPEIRKAMAAGWTAPMLRKRHREWCKYYATLTEGKFIPMLFRWFTDGDYTVKPVIRKPHVKETYADRLMRQIREA